MKGLIAIWIMVSAIRLMAVEPGDVIINEVYFYNKGSGKNHYEAVEILVVKDKVDLNELQVTDRDRWNIATEDQCTLNDLGKGFLSSVPAGTLIVIYNGTGNDDIDPSDFTLRFYCKSSLFTHAAPTGNAFSLNNHGDNIHLLQSGRQIDFVKYRATDETRLAGDPGNLTWQDGTKGAVDIGETNENVGIRFIGNTAELNDYPATWQPYPEVQVGSGSNLGKPNGGRNTQWIMSLREKSGEDSKPASEKNRSTQK